MRRGSKHRQLFGAAMVLAIAMAACAGKSTRRGSDDGTGGRSSTDGALDCNGYCSELSRCTNVSPEGCVSSCEQAATETRAIGCFPEYETVHDCFLANGLCGFGEDACSVEMTAYALCASNSRSIICKTACQRQAACTDLFPESCLVTCGRDARLTADVGCSAEYDAYVTCSISHPDPCELASTGCTAEDEAVWQCALR